MLYNDIDKSYEVKKMGKDKKVKDKDNLPKECKYCENATVISDDDYILCSRHGIVSKQYHCKKYAYDPLKRVPKQMPPMPRLSEEDLLL